MGLQNFIQPGYYSKISKITLDLDSLFIRFSMRTLSGKNGEDVLAPIDFSIQKENEIKKYLEANPAVLPEHPEYPQICVDREAMTPMWTTETDEEKALYYDAVQDYENDVAVRDMLVTNLNQAARQAAKTNNDYSQFFSKAKLFQTSNPVRCAYMYLKSRGSFAGVTDDE